MRPARKRRLGLLAQRSGYVSARYSNAAKRDLIAIYLDGEAKFGSRQAAAYTTGLGATVRMISNYPLSSRLRTELDLPVRVRTYKAHVIIYVIEEGGVLVLRFRHGHEDWQSDPLGGDLDKDKP